MEGHLVRRLAAGDQQDRPARPHLVADDPGDLHRREPTQGAAPRRDAERRGDDLRVHRQRHHQGRRRPRRRALHPVPRRPLPLHPVPELLGGHPLPAVPADVAHGHPGLPGDHGVLRVPVHRVQEPGDQVPHRPPLPARRPEVPLHPGDAHRVRAAVPRAALLAGRPTPRQHDGGTHPAHRARPAHRVLAHERPDHRHRSLRPQRGGDRLRDPRRVPAGVHLHPADGGLPRRRAAP